MPAERTKSIKRSDSTGNQLVWANQCEPSTPSEVSFTPNMTSFMYDDGPPPLVDAPTEFILFPPPEETAAPRRQPHSKKKPENHIPRPPNAFILFRSSFIKGQHVSTEVETNHSTLSKIIGITWQSLPEDERQVWHHKAKEALEEHKRKFPKYAFRPVQTKSKGAQSEKRKVREVEPKDIKRCTKIAQLLVQGKKGEELNSAIQEFDKHHVPEIVTRFEAPITARAYRRSSSAPVPDVERTGQSFLQTIISSPARKPRASSTRPTRSSTPETFEGQVFTPNAFPSPTLESQALPLKQEASFKFGEFTFDNVASPAPSYDCDPLAFDNNHFNSGLTIDTDFMSMSDWSASPSPMTPSTPNYMMSHSPMLSSSPAPPYVASFDAFEQVHLEKQFNDFSAHFPAVFDQTCGGVAQQQIGMCGGGVTADTSMYAVYAQQPHHEQSHLGHLDLDFSAFMTGLPQYTM